MTTFEADIYTISKEMIEYYTELGFSLDETTILKRLKKVMAISNERKTINITLNTLIKIAIETEIIIQIKRTHNKEIQNKFICLYTKLIESIAHESISEKDYNLYEDVFQYLFCLAITIIYKFNEESGNAFSTYLQSYLSYKVGTFIYTSTSPIHLGQKASQKKQRINRISSNLYIRGIYPNPQKISVASGYPIKDVNQLLLIDSLTYTSFQEYRDGISYDETISTDRLERITEEADNYTITEELKELLAKFLTYQELKIFIEYFINIDYMTLNEICMSLDRKHQIIITIPTLYKNIQRILAKIRYQIYKGENDIARYFSVFFPKNLSLLEMSSIDSKVSSEDILPYHITSEELQKLSLFFNEFGKQEENDKITDEEKLIIGLNLGIIGGTPLQYKEIEKRIGISKELCIIICEAYGIHRNHVKKQERLIVNK